MTVPNGVTAWGMSSSKDVQASVAMEYPTRRLRALFNTTIHPELDASKVLDYDKSAFYKSQIGVLRSIVKLVGRIDFVTEVSEVSTMLVMPREGHLDAIFHLFKYLEKRHNARIVFNPSYRAVNMTSSKTECK